MSQVDQLIGLKIKTRRNALRLSQTGLAEAIGVRFQQVQKYESGANRVSASRLLSIAKALNVPVAFFFQGLDALPEENGSTAISGRATPSINALPNPVTAEMVALLESLPTEQQQAVMAFLRSLAQTAVKESVA